MKNLKLTKNHASRFRIEIDKSRSRRDEKLQEKCKKGLSNFPYYSWNHDLDIKSSNMEKLDI
jgi:hypothetical protein